ncbi:MAG: 3-dehydroquinate synthase [Clostridia bacterium]
MKKITVNAKNAYNIIIGEKTLEECGILIKQNFGDRNYCIISDDIVWKLYGAVLEKTLTENSISFKHFIFKNGEKSKNLSTANDIYNFLSKINFTRNDIIIAFGGGVVGDISGFVASTYLRGVKYIQIPTTFLAQIDSSVGGKTAVDIAAGKNLVGTFWQPSEVYCDPCLLKTLSADIFSDGASEAIKYGVIYDKNIFQLIANDINEHLNEIIYKCISIKRDIVEKDEFDNGIRMILNFGHTLGHCIEMHSGFRITHGKAIAIGMSIICKYGEEYGYTKKGTYDLLTYTLRKNHLPTSYEAKLNEFIDIAKNDKKCSGDNITIAFLEQIGKATTATLPFEEFKQNLLKLKLD